MIEMVSCYMHVHMDRICHMHWAKDVLGCLLFLVVACNQDGHYREDSHLSSILIHSCLQNLHSMRILRSDNVLFLLNDGMDSLE